MLETIKAISKFNPWYNNQISSGFTRQKYLSTITNYLGNNLIKILSGQRRVGKSYLFRQIINHLITQGTHPNNILYLNFEHLGLSAISNYQKLDKLIQFYRRKLHPIGKIYLFFDEIQDINSWEKTINSYSQDHTIPCEIFLTGSNSRLLSSQLSTLISGRFITFDIYPFDFHEYCQYLNLPQNKTSFIHFLESGGLPEILHLASSDTIRNYLSALKDSIILNDIVKRFQVKDAYLLEKIFEYLTDNTGHLVSTNSIVNTLKSQNIKTNFETLSNYLSYLSQSHLVHQCPQYEIKGKKILIGPKKFYLNDHSFRNYLSSQFDPGLNQILENYFYVYYSSLGYKVFTGQLRSKEIDFILQKGKDCQYIQITYLLKDKNTIDREFGNLAKIPDHYPKTVISLDDISFGSQNGITHSLAWEV